MFRLPGTTRRSAPARRPRLRLISTQWSAGDVVSLASRPVQQRRPTRSADDGRRSVVAQLGGAVPLRHDGDDAA